VPGFSFFTDNHVRGPLIKFMRHRGQHVDRAVDFFGQENDYGELVEVFERLAARDDPFSPATTTSRRSKPS